MTLSKGEVLDTIAEMTVMEIVELVEAMEEKFGVSAAAVAAPAQAAVAGGAADAVEEQTSFDVILTVVGDKKVNVIKAVRSITNLGLKEAKGLVDVVAGGGTSPVREGAAKEEAEEFKKQLEEAGATVELK